MKRLPIVSSALARAFSGALAAAALAACGSLDSKTDSQPTLATVQGAVIDPPTVPVTGSVRVAVVWRTETPGVFRVAQDLPVSAEFPAKFTIDFDGPPPPEAMNIEGSLGNQSGASDASSVAVGQSGGGLAMQSLRTFDLGAATPEFAIGTVVAYVDTNGNGMLDLIADDAGSYVDRIVATNVETSIFYFQGAIPSVVAMNSRGVPVEGYNLLDDPPCNESPPTPQTNVASSLGWPANAACILVDAGVAADDAGTPSATCAEPSWLPIGTTFDLTAATAPEISQVACLNGGPSQQPSESTGSGGPPPDPSMQPATYPDPCDPSLACNTDGSQYLYFMCTVVDQGLCLAPSTSCTSVGYSRPTPVPAGWPCIH